MTTITNLVCDPVTKYCHLSQKSSDTFRHFAHPVTAILDGAAGIIASLGNLLYCGKNDTLREFARHNLNSFGAAAPLAYVSIIRVLNSRIILVKEEAMLLGSKYAIYEELESWTETHILEKIGIFANTLSESDNCFKAEVLSRGCYLFYLIASVVTHAFDCLVGITAAFFSTIGLGRCAALNRIAFSHLKFAFVVSDCVCAIQKIVNPKIHV